MTSIPVDIHRELSEQQQQSEEMSTLRFVVLFSLYGATIFLLLFGFYFTLGRMH